MLSCTFAFSWFLKISPHWLPFTDQTLGYFACRFRAPPVCLHAALRLRFACGAYKSGQRPQKPPKSIGCHIVWRMRMGRSGSAYTCHAQKSYASTASAEALMSSRKRWLAPRQADSKLHRVEQKANIKTYMLWLLSLTFAQCKGRIVGTEYSPRRIPMYPLLMHGPNLCTVCKNPT